MVIFHLFWDDQAGSLLCLRLDSGFNGVNLMENPMDFHGGL